MIDYIKSSINKAEKTIGKIIPIAMVIISIIFVTLYYILNRVLFDDALPLLKILVIALLIAIYMVIYLLISRKLAGEFKKEFRKIEDQFEFTRLITENTSEMILLLNGFGQIIEYNSAFKKSFHIDDNDFKGKPLREIFSLSDIADDLNYKQMILDKLKDVFEGIEAEIISPVKITGMDDIQNVQLKLTPLFVGDELSSIFVIGKLLQSDFIANSWLTNETSHYRMTNEIRQINLFCYRLTRNLDGKLSRNQILFVQIALQEALINAIEHGNLEVDYDKKTELKLREGNYLEILLKESDEGNIKNRRVHIDYILEDNRVVYRILDDGKGFNWHEFMVADDALLESIFTNYHGVGLQMIKNSFDEVSFNEQGNEITLVKNFDLV
ncbi:MAG: hypothetical protein GY754_21305 [bacterium]|nr:hypothetical protein [bacterium]